VRQDETKVVRQLTALHHCIFIDAVNFRRVSSRNRNPKSYLILTYGINGVGEIFSSTESSRAGAVVETLVGASAKLRTPLQKES